MVQRLALESIICLTKLYGAYAANVATLTDAQEDTYWQSDGLAPHVIVADFSRRTAVHAVELLLSWDDDESYTPRKVTVRAGSTALDVEDLTTVEFEEPNGWQQIDLIRPDGSAPRVFHLQVPDFDVWMLECLTACRFVSSPCIRTVATPTFGKPDC